MLAILALAAASIVPGSAPIPDQFDVIELNHVLDDHAFPAFDQLIFWRWDPLSKRHVCHGWRLLKGCRDCTDEKDRQWFQRQVDAIRRPDATFFARRDAGGRRRLLRQ